MATVFNPFSSDTGQDEDKNNDGQQKQAQSGGNNSLSTSGESADVGGGGASGGAFNPKAQTKSGSFTNIQSYLNANKDVAPGLTNQVAGNIQNNANQAHAGIAKARSAFDTASAAGTLTQDNATNARNTIDNAGQQVYGAGTTDDTTGYTPNQKVIDTFNRTSSGAYKGPTNLENYGGLSNQAQNVRDMGQLSNTDNGRFTLLRQMFNNPNYTAGQTNLDQLLVGANQKQLAPARQQAYQLPAFANSNIQGAADTAGEYTRQSKQIGQDAKNYLNDQTFAQTTANTKALTDAAQAETDRAANFNSISQAIKNNAVTAANAKTFGIDTDQPLYNLNLNDYLKTNLVAGPTTVDQIISEKNAARTNALGLLAKASPQFADLTKVGGFTPSTQTFDVDKFNKAREAEAGGAQSMQDALSKWGNARLLLHPNETTGGGLYNDIANSSYNDMIQKYGSLGAAQSAATSGFQGQDYDYDYESRMVQNLMDALGKYNINRRINVLPEPKS